MENKSINAYFKANNYEEIAGCGLKGIIKKVGYIIIVAVSTLADSIVGDTGVIRTAVIYIFVANELLSVLENWAAMGLPCPKMLLDKLEQLKNKNESEVK